LHYIVTFTYAFGGATISSLLIMVGGWGIRCGASSSS